MSFYAEHSSRSFFGSLVKYMTRYVLNSCRRLLILWQIAQVIFMDSYPLEAPCQLHCRIFLSYLVNKCVFIYSVSSFPSERQIRQMEKRTNAIASSLISFSICCHFGQLLLYLIRNIKFYQGQLPCLLGYDVSPHHKFDLVCILGQLV